MEASPQETLLLGTTAWGPLLGSAPAVEWPASVMMMTVVSGLGRVVGTAWEWPPAPCGPSHARPPNHQPRGEGLPARSSGCLLLGVPSIHRLRLSLLPTRASSSALLLAAGALVIPCQKNSWASPRGRMGSSAPGGVVGLPGPTHRPDGARSQGSWPRRGRPRAAGGLGKSSWGQEQKEGLLGPWPEVPIPSRH